MCSSGRPALSGSQSLAKEAEEPIQVKGENDACKLADHEERRGAGSLCPRSLAQLTDIPFFNMDEETSDATIQSESPGSSPLSRPSQDGRVIAEK